MSDPAKPDSPDPDDYSDDELGGLTVEDDPEGTVDPGELAGTANEHDDDPLPEYSENDLED